MTSIKAWSMWATQFGKMTVYTQLIYIFFFRCFLKKKVGNLPKNQKSFSKNSKEEMRFLPTFLKISPKARLEKFTELLKNSFNDNDM